MRLNVRGPFYGLNKIDESSLLDPREAEDALNVSPDRSTIRKRPGYTVDGTGPSANPVLGLFDFGRDDGQRFQLVKLNGALYKFSGGTFTSIGTGYSTTELARFATIENKLVIVDPGIEPKVWDGTAGSVFPLLMESPGGFGPDLSAASGGVLSGSYDYKYTYYSSTWGIESASSPSVRESPGANERSTIITVNQQAIQLTNWILPTDSRVDKFRIYRRKTSALEADWFLVEEITKPATVGQVYVDNWPDSSVSNRLLAPLTFSVAIPAARFVAYHEGVTYLAGFAATPKRILISPAGKPFAPLDAADSITGTGDITGIEIFQGERVVFTQQAIWVISGPRDRLSFLKVIPDVGCVAPHSIVALEDVILFFADQGFYVYDLGRPREISEKIKPLLDERNTARDKFMVGVHYPQFACVIWQYSGAGSSVNNRGLAYFYRASARRKRDIWVPWEFPGISHFASYIDASTQERKVRLGFTNGKVGTVGGVNDDTAAVEYLWQTGQLNFGDIERDKNFGDFVLETTKQDVSKPLDVEYLLNSDPDIHQLGRHRMDRETFRGRLRRRGREIRMRFHQNETNSDAEIIGWSIDAMRAGRSLA